MLSSPSCKKTCAKRIAEWCDPSLSGGIAPGCEGFTAAEIIEACKRCGDIERCRGTEEANRCYSGGSGGGPPWLKPEASLYYGDSQSSKDLWLLELETPVTECFSFTTSAQTETFSGLGTAELFSAVRETGSAALSVLASEHQPSIEGERGSDEISLGALGLGAKLYLYRGFFASVGVDSYFELEGAREISDLAYRLGVGYQRLINSRLSVRGEVRYRVFDELDLDGLSAIVGIGIRFGKKKPPRKLVRPNPKDVEGQKEGAINVVQ